MQEIDLEKLPHGDMPGDSIKIEETHIAKANVIYPVLKPLIEGRGADAKTVVCVCGGSGVGKSEIASLLAGMLCADGIGAYVMSGDNYPHRIPCENDAERERVFAEGGKDALAAYLGSQAEIDFAKVSDILARFKAGEKTVSLKRMGRTKDALWYDDIDFSATRVLILEWTHGNSDNITGVDIPILLNSTPEETLEHRRSRARDGGVDSPFVTMVLELEQAQLMRQAHKAKIIVTKAGEIISYDEYRALMEAARSAQADAVEAAK